MRDDGLKKYNPKDYIISQFRRTTNTMLCQVYGLEGTLNTKERIDNWFIGNWKMFTSDIFKAEMVHSYNEKELDDFYNMSCITCDACAYLNRAKSKAATGIGIKFYNPTAEVHQSDKNLYLYSLF